VSACDYERHHGAPLKAFALPRSASAKIRCRFAACLPSFTSFTGPDRNIHQLHSHRQHQIEPREASMLSPSSRQRITLLSAA
jgi:hypothetical protein